MDVLRSYCRHTGVAVPILGVSWLAFVLMHGVGTLAQSRADVDEATSHHALARLLPHIDAYDSSSSGNSFMCQRVGFELDGQQFREVVDWRNGAGIYALIGAHNLPTKVHVDNTMLYLRDEDATWNHADDFQWRFQFDASHYNGCLGSGRVRDPAPPSIVVDPESFARMILQHANADVRWHPASRTLAASGPYGDTLLVRFRSKSDMVRFGSDLSCVRGETSDGSVFEMNCFCTKDVAYSRLAHRKADELARLSGSQPIPLEAKTYQFELGRLSLPARRQAEPMWCGLLSRRSTLEARRTQEMEELSTQGALLEASLISATSEEEPSNDSEERAETATNTLHADMTAECIERWLDKSHSLVERGSDVLYPDDPHMRWLRTEYLLGPEKVHRFYLVGFVPMVHDKPMSKLARARLLQAVSALGKPALEKSDCVLGGIDLDPFSAAIVRSRSCVPCTKEQTATCEDIVADASSNIELCNIAITTLSLLGKLDRVPRHRLEEWLNKQVCQESGARRLRNLAEISSQPSGLALLETAFDGGFFEPEVKRDVEAVIAARSAR